MSITDELRGWMKGSTLSSWTAEHLTAIADRIDAEHQKAEDEWRAKNGDMWLKGYAVCHEELMEGHPVIAADLEKAGWVELPKDADGEYIHVGDEVETTNFGTVEVEGFVHRAVAFYNYSEQPAYLCTTPANLCRHYHKPTVEDVLREFAEKMNENLGMYTGEAIDADEWRSADAKTIAEYAKRLTLADDRKEQ